jgi:hypothetical protein
MKDSDETTFVSNFDKNEFLTYHIIVTRLNITLKRKFFWIERDAYGLRENKLTSCYSLHSRNGNFNHYWELVSGDKILLEHFSKMEDAPLIFTSN